MKFCAWENYFTKRIRAAREKELGQLKAKKYLDAGCVYFWASTPILMSVLTFITYVQLGNELTPTKVFTSLALFNMLINPLNAFPWVINGLVQANVSLKRVQQFLKLENLNWLSYYTLDESLGSRSTDTLVDLNHAEFSWRQSHGDQALNDHNVGQNSVLEDISLKVLTFRCQNYFSNIQILTDKKRRSNRHRWQGGLGQELSITCTDSRDRKKRRQCENLA